MASVDELRARGNTAFKAADYPHAIEAYTAALALAEPAHPDCAKVGITRGPCNEPLKQSLDDPTGRLVPIHWHSALWALFGDTRSRSRALTRTLSQILGNRAFCHLKIGESGDEATRYVTNPHGPGPGPLPQGCTAQREGGGACQPMLDSLSASQ
jgi:hypothetical protein